MKEKTRIRPVQPNIIFNFIYSYRLLFQLSRDWVSESGSGGVGRTVLLGGGSLPLRLRLLPPERSSRRVPTTKPGALFGAKITHVAK